MDVLLGVLLGVVLSASVFAVSRLLAPRRVLAPGEEGRRSDQNGPGKPHRRSAC